MMRKPEQKSSSGADPVKKAVEQYDALQLAFEKLQDKHLSREQIRRVSIERSGDIHIETYDADKSRFFIFAGNALREFQPKNDLKVPLANKLFGEEFATHHQVISYRPGRRIVIESVGKESAYIIKGYKKHRSAEAAKRYTIAASICESSGFDVPKLLQYETDQDCLVMSKRQGQTPGITESAAKVWRGIGISLKRFQQSPLTGELPTFSFNNELDVLRERARRFLLCKSTLPSNWSGAFERLTEVTRNLPPAVNGLAHRDLHDGQFIVSGNTTSLLDFDLMCVADVALDAGNLLAHMKLRIAQKKPESGDSAFLLCSDSFLQGLGRQRDPNFKWRLTYYQATTFYRLALLYALRPRWSHLTGALVLEGNRCIDSISGSGGQSCD